MNYTKNQKRGERKKLSRRNDKFKKPIIRKTKGHCAYCGKGLRKQDYTFDHIVPVIDGGLTVYENLFLACERCNTLKANLPLDDFKDLFIKSGLGYKGNQFWFEYKGIAVD